MLLIVSMQYVLTQPEASSLFSVSCQIADHNYSSIVVRNYKDPRFVPVFLPLFPFVKITYMLVNHSLLL